MIDTAGLWRAIGLLVLAAVARFFYRLYQVRTFVRKFARDNDLEMAPHSFLFGHIVESAKILAPYPMDMFPIGISTFMLKKYPHLEKNGFVLIDSWPFVPPMLYVFDPEMSTQFTQVHSLPKGNDVKAEFRPLTQNKDLVTLDGQEWKFWRSVFNPGFSAKNLMSMTPWFLEEIRIFKDRLRKAAETGEVMEIEEPAINLTIDIIGRAILGTRMHTQTKPNNPLQWALAKQISWLIPEYTPPSLLKLINPFRPPLVWYYNRVIRNYLMPIIRQTVAAQADATKPSEAGETKTVLSLAAKAFIAEKKASTGSAPSPSALLNNNEFASMTIPQLVIFLFAGHDTTATTLCFAYYLLLKNPAALAALRAEHDSVLGPDPREAEARISASPQLLNALPYTSAVIKETLRLFAPALTARQGTPDFSLTHPPTGRRYPTNGMVVLQNSHTTHHLESIFARADEFLPERFLVPAEDEKNPLRVPRNAYRPFELGPRACIGQELAQLELRMILALTAREFEFEDAYKAGMPVIFGHGTYQVGNVTGHPKDGMPVRVRVRDV